MLQVPVFVLARTPPDWGGHLVLHQMCCAVLSLLEGSGKSLLLLLLAHLVSRCSELRGLFGLCGDDLSNTVTTLERDSPRINKAF